MKKDLTYKILFILLAIFITRISFAEVASSTNYQIESDSLNFAGTEQSSSTSYIISDTAGEIGTGEATSTSYTLLGGYRQMAASAVATTITISAPSNVTLSQIDVTSGGTGTGEIEWTVTTNSSSGYTLTVIASSSPALTSGGESFDDYSPSGGTPDYTWSLGSSNAAFGFSPEGSDITSTYQDNGTSCSTGSSDASSACWDSFSTSNKTVASSASSNSPSGTATTIKLQAEANTSATIAAGSYSATITATATAL